MSAGKNHFEGHQALERTLLSLIDNAHASPAQLCDDLVTRHHGEFGAGVAAARGAGERALEQRQLADLRPSD